MTTDTLCDDDGMQREIRHLFTRSNILTCRFASWHAVDVKIALLKLILLACMILDYGWDIRWPHLINYHPVIINVWNCSSGLNVETVLRKFNLILGFRVLALLYKTAKLLLVHHGVIVQIASIKHLGSTVCSQLRYMYVCICCLDFVLSLLLGVFIKCFFVFLLFSDKCMLSICLSLCRFVLMCLAVWYEWTNECHQSRLTHRCGRLVCSDRSAAQNYFRGIRRSRVSHHEWQTPTQPTIYCTRCSGSRRHASDDRCAPSPVHTCQCTVPTSIQHWCKNVHIYTTINFTSEHRNVSVALWWRKWALYLRLDGRGRCTTDCTVVVIINKNSSVDEIANVNFSTTTSYM